MSTKKWSSVLGIIITVIICMLCNHGVNGNCQLQDSYIRNEWRLALLYDNENLQLLREPTVKDGSVLYMVCNSDDITIVTCENGQFNPPLPLAACPDHLLPQLKLENNKQLCPYHLYCSGFQIHCQDRDYFFETFKACFDFEHKRAVFTINEAYPFVISRPYGMQFDPDDIFTRNIFAAYNKRDIYARFNEILGYDQRYMPNNAGDERFDRGHLAPAGDYMMNSLIASTFKMINVIPQFHTINDGNWRLMEEWARNPINTPSKVCSGAFELPLVLSDSQGDYKAMYLREPNIIPIPLWTYKIVLNRHGVRTVFLQFNNIHHRKTPPDLLGGVCQQVACPSTIALKNSNYYGYTFCCEPKDFMQRIVPNLQGHC